MLVGMGTDIIAVARVERALGRWGDRFLKRIFTPRERAMGLGRKDALYFWAGRFAAKEAVLKALGTGRQGISFREIEVVADDKGRPVVKLFGRARLRAEELGIKEIWLSIAHEKEYAVAVACAERRE
ncbi:holo-acyl-carrier-protein synthase [Ammonifex degensii KC4]|uniref:Holo-[acyl-carrier-protein] synthase n=1 Tax=Ammonifex degensii (strain DSM 10501 / KC4) TaxID=429009 RepID=C9R970_AMMDK|nr:holo-ACP synthase [Ammonifex degensii]ACX52849.1 holo-acyl-carrier-protein synthase [Ammonifex degensii KC4]